MPKVYVINEPMKWSKPLRMMSRAIDISPAERYGQLVFLLPPGNIEVDDPKILEQLHAGLSTFGPLDYLLPIGHPIAIGYACSIATARTKGRIKQLHWIEFDHAYRVIEANTYAGFAA